MIDIESRLHADGAHWRNHQSDAISEAKSEDYGNLPLSLHPVTSRPSFSRRWLVSALVAAVVALLIAFTFTRLHSSGSEQAASPTTTAVAVPPLTLATVPASADPVMPPAPSAVARIGLPQPKPVEIISTGKGVISMPWALTSVSSNGKLLTVLYAAGDGDCHVPAGFEVKQSETSVELIAVSTAKSPKSAQDGCASQLILAQATITLSMPLNKRALLHAPTDPGWSNVLQSTLDQLK